MRQIADIWFDDRPTGLSGDDDGGALPAWYVFAAMGFYPVDPASGEYALSTPIFERVEIALPGGRSFVIEAPGASKVNKYIRAARLDGKPHARADRAGRSAAAGACVAALSGLFPVAGAGSDGSGAAGLSGCSALKGPIPGHKKTPHGAEYQANNC